MIDLASWPALVLTAGRATRLQPLSEVRAKAAMPVAGTAIIGRILTWLRDAGIRRAVLNLHHRPETITAAVGDGSSFGIEVRYSWERALLGSAGGPRHALSLLEADRFFIINGDTLTNCDLQAIAAQHAATAARVTMAVVPGDIERYGGVLMDEHARVRAFGQPRPDTRALHFIGVQTADANVFATLPDGEPAETVKTLYPRLIAQQAGAVAAYESDAEFLDVGTARDYLMTVVTVAAREHRSLDVGVDCDIAESARIEGTVLWDRVTVGAGAHLANCVAADNVLIPAGSRYDACVFVQSAAGLVVAPLHGAIPGAVGKL